MKNKFIGFLLIYLVSACSGHARPPAHTQADLSLVVMEGLTATEVNGLELAYVRDGVDFSKYTSILPGQLELAFTLPNANEKRFPLDKAQKAEFRGKLRHSFEQAFSQSSTLPLTDSSSAQTLLLNVRVQDINVVLSPQAVGTLGIGRVALQAAGKATLSLELRDSQTEAIVARAVDARALEGGGVLNNDTVLSYWSDLDTLCNYWAETSHKRIVALLQEHKR